MNLLTKLVGKNGASRRTLRLVLSVMALIAGASFCFLGDEWHSQPTFYYLNKLPVSWVIYGVALVIAAVLIVIPKVKPIGYLIGGIVYSVFSIGTWLAFLGAIHILQNFPADTVSSVIAATNFTTIATLYLQATKEAVYQQIDPEHSVKN